MNKILTILFALITLSSAKPNDRVAHVILFVPENEKPPENYKVILDSLAKRAESFFSDGITHWKHPNVRRKFFARNPEDNVEVTLVKSKLQFPNGREALPELREKALNTAAKKLKLTRNQSFPLFWIFYHYPGVKGFQGGARGTGGVAINAYPDGLNPIDIKALLASPALNEHAIKGTIHEFGHALGLPHIGPRPDVDLGNSLMGPINKVYWRKTGKNDPRVYLTEASASALSRHPVFQKEAVPEPEQPTIKVLELSGKESADQKRFVITGKLESDLPAHSVIALDSSRGRYGDYWTRSYLAKIDQKNGEFSVTITSPYDSGTIFLSFCFKNGINSSNGNQSFQQNSTVYLKYTTKEGKKFFQRE
ncbi:MAG: hypothetical protein ABF379_07430 [Akkermansiaceae bacterium]